MSTPSLITKIVIPRGMSFYNPFDGEDIDDEGLIKIFPNLKTIVRIHNDGAVLSYNVETAELN
jgi:hypothetical protein